MTEYLIMYDQILISTYEMRVRPVGGTAILT